MQSTATLLRMPQGQVTWPQNTFLDVSGVKKYRAWPPEAVTILDVGTGSIRGTTYIHGAADRLFVIEMGGESCGLGKGLFKEKSNIDSGAVDVAERAIKKLANQSARIGVDGFCALGTYMTRVMEQTKRGRAIIARFNKVLQEILGPQVEIFILDGDQETMLTQKGIEREIAISYDAQLPASLLEQNPFMGTGSGSVHGGIGEHYFDLPIGGWSLYNRSSGDPDKAYKIAHEDLERIDWPKKDNTILTVTGNKWFNVGRITAAEKPATEVRRFPAGHMITPWKGLRPDIKATMRKANNDMMKVTAASLLAAGERADCPDLNFCNSNIRNGAALELGLFR